MSDYEDNSFEPYWRETNPNLGVEYSNETEERYWVSFNLHHQYGTETKNLVVGFHKAVLSQEDWDDFESQVWSEVKEIFPGYAMGEITALTHLGATFKHIEGID